MVKLPRQPLDAAFSGTKLNLLRIIPQFEFCIHDRPPWDMYPMKPLWRIAFVSASVNLGRRAST
jgi:hypothetical protein